MIISSKFLVISILNIVNNRFKSMAVSTSVSTFSKHLTNEFINEQLDWRYGFEDEIENKLYRMSEQFEAKITRIYKILEGISVFQKNYTCAHNSCYKKYYNDKLLELDNQIRKNNLLQEGRIGFLEKQVANIFSLYGNIKRGFFKDDKLVHSRSKFDFSSVNSLKVIEPRLNESKSSDCSPTQGSLDIFSLINKGDISAIQRLISSDVKNLYKESDDFEHCTPLMKAICKNKLEIVKLLLRSGACVNEKNTNGNTPLMIAARFATRDIMDCLLKNGAYINDQNNEGRTPLIEASLEGRINAVTYLVQKGADVNVRSNKGKTALSYAKQFGHIPIVNYLRGIGASE